jgi:hypothetical protein
LSKQCNNNEQSHDGVVEEETQRQHVVSVKERLQQEIRLILVDVQSGFKLHIVASWLQLCTLNFFVVCNFFGGGQCCCLSAYELTICHLMSQDHPFHLCCCDSINVDGGGGLTGSGRGAIFCLLLMMATTAVVALLMALKSKSSTCINQRQNPPSDHITYLSQ